LPRLNVQEKCFSSILVILTASEGQSFTQSMHPTQPPLGLNTGRPRKLAGRTGRSLGYIRVAGLRHRFLVISRQMAPGRV
jgi:hypothetical protein